VVASARDPSAMRTCAAVPLTPRTPHGRHPRVPPPRPSSRVPVGRDPRVPPPPRSSHPAHPLPWRGCGSFAVVSRATSCEAAVVALIPQPLLPPVIRQEKGSTQHSHPARLLRRSHRALLATLPSRASQPPFSCRITGGRRGWGMRATTAASQEVACDTTAEEPHPWRGVVGAMVRCGRRDGAQRDARDGRRDVQRAGEWMGEPGCARRLRPFCPCRPAGRTRTGGAGGTNRVVHPTHTAGGASASGDVARGPRCRQRHRSAGTCA
jgi:hypothetical protein